MPIYDLGYRGWQGRTIPEAGRFWAITDTGIRLAWRTKFLRGLPLLGLIPAAVFAVGFFAFEQVVSTGMKGEAVGFLRGLLGEIPVRMDRHFIWSALLCNFFRYPQATVMALLVGIIAPPLVANDVRSRAFMLYFSRPLTRIEYVLGKMAVLWAYLLMIATIPALCLYVLGVFLSPQFSVVADTWDLPLRILGASAVLMIPTAALALALSSLTSESRYATFAWFGIWVAGSVAWAIVNGNFPDIPPGSRTPAQTALVERVTLASLYHTLGHVEKWVFGLEDSFAKVSSAAIELAAITVVSLMVLFRRVSSPMRV
jgi:ABC-type transport system involved in multi-copper enzyme maturation permease subunit